MKNIIQPDPISLTTYHLYLGYNDKVLASGTAFAYENEGKFYLITNWHNVTGKHPETKKPVSDTGGLPNIVATYFQKKGKPGYHNLENICLYHDKDNLNPIWYEHPRHKEKVDVVAIPLNEALVHNTDIYPINKIEFETRFKEEVSDEAFIIGYPFSKNPYLQLPIWKKASIASEPDVNIDQLPKMFVDTATRPGLSGSPVVMQRIGVHAGSDGKMLSPDTLFGRIRNFIGVYSGRIGDDEFKAQLGIVWKKTVIEEIIDGKCIGQSQF